MRILALIALFISISTFSKGQHEVFKSDFTPTWKEAISAFDHLAKASDEAQFFEKGKTDIGKPLHVLVINSDKVFDAKFFDPKKTVLLINNAIHPGEPDGVDACLQLCKELLDKKNTAHALLDSVIICIIPIYNVDGAHIRNSYSRSNQEGPLEYGFRGNAKNLDLNRDFIKCDSKNAISFSQIFHEFNPDIFVDTHVSNGADYQYTMTLIATQANKLGANQKDFIRKIMEPALYTSMESKTYPMTPYVNHMGKTPESGLADFLETPRFASGYAALFQCISFITETHMLKPYPQRVEATYHFLHSMLEFIDTHSHEIITEREKACAYWKEQKEYALNYQLDTTYREYFRFKGYEALSEPSLIGNGERLRYDRNQPFEKDIPLFRTFISKDSISIPKYYVVPQAWQQVIDRLNWNNINYTRLESDTLMEVHGYYLKNENTLSEAYEGHYLHTSVKTFDEKMKILFFEGDLIVPVEQDGIRYILETLEPKGKDSFYSWNFFDAVLQQKEWFSDYVFEEKAQQILKDNPELKAEFEKELPNLEEHWEQLYWIYRHSPYFERSAFRYPIYRIY